MPVPKKRVSISKRRLRRTHDKLFPTFSVICPTTGCGEPVLRHRVCTNCGQYRGQQLLPDRRSQAQA